MVLRPLEFSDCLSDSPWFRQNVAEHEAALEQAYKHIKHIEHKCTELIDYARTGCLQEFGQLICQVEDQRVAILEEAERLYIEPLHQFRRERIGKALQEDKKKFDKASAKYYSSLEKHLHLSTAVKRQKHKNVDFKEVDEALEMERCCFYKASFDYVFVLQSVEERLKFDFVKTLSTFLYSWLSFYHIGHIIHEDFKPYLDEVQIKVEKTRESFEAMQAEAESLKHKMLSLRHNAFRWGQHNQSQTAVEPSTSVSNDAIAPQHSSNIHQGYLYLMERKRSIGLTNWTKYYCVYQKESHIFTMIPYSQSMKQDMHSAVNAALTFKLKSCSHLPSTSIDKRFCFEIVPCDRPSSEPPLTLQAPGEHERTLWLDAMSDHREHLHGDVQGNGVEAGGGAHQKDVVRAHLNSIGADFLKMSLEQIEFRGLDEQGLYRNCGVTSKVQKLLQLGLNERTQSIIDWSDDNEWEIRTITSAVKTYLRVTDNSGKNLMTVGNLGVCFGPSLLRPKEETLSAIMDIKFCNVVVEILIKDCDFLFSRNPAPLSVPPRPPKPEHCLDFDQTMNVLPPAVKMFATMDNRLCGNSNDTLDTSHSQPTNTQHLNRTQLEPCNASLFTLGTLPTAIVPSSPAHSWAGRLNADSNTSRSGGNRQASARQSSQPPEGRVRGRMSISYAPPYPGTDCTSHATDQSNHHNGNIIIGNFNRGRVRTLYDCAAGHPSELSFEPGQIVTNVYPSREQGWLVGTLNGKTGLIPANYVEQLP